MGNTTIKINLHFFKELMWSVILLFVLRIFNVTSSEETFIISCAIIVFYVGFMKKIVIPRIYGLNFYLIFICYSLAVGVTLYETRNVIRDLYYMLPTVALVILGYYLYTAYKEEKSLYATAVLMAVFAAVSCVIDLLKDVSALDSLDSIRDVFGSGSYESMIAFLMLLAIIYVGEKKIFSNWVQILFLGIMLAHIILSFARSVWIGTMLGSAVIYIVGNIKRNNIVKAVKDLVKIAIIVGICAIIFNAVAPESVREEFFDKFSNTVKEMDSEQTFDSTTDAMYNWRGYEIQSAKKQWKKSSAIEEIFGQGLGKGIYIEYVPNSWVKEDMVEGNEIPLLHNSYYTVLIKGGLVGAAALIWFMMSNVIFPLKYAIKNKKISVDATILISISMVMLVITYVARGPVAQSTFMLWSFLVGWINAKLRNETDEHGKINEFSKTEEINYDHNNMLL